jgi:hypothetical protein
MDEDIMCKEEIEIRRRIAAGALMVKAKSARSAGARLRRKQEREAQREREARAWLTAKIMRWTEEGRTEPTWDYGTNACCLVGYLLGAAELTEEQHAQVDERLWGKKLPAAQ